MKELKPINYKEEVVITTKILAEVYECDVLQIQQNFNNNKDKFIKDKHYYKIEGEELKNLRLENFELQISPKTRTLYLWTKRGASRHCKMLGTDKAWEMFDALEENYFNPKPQLTKHDQAILNIINSRTDIEQAIAIKDFEKVVTEPLHDEIKVLKPKAHYTDIILQNKGLIKVTSIAKDYGMSAQEFNKLLCDFKIQYRLGNQWFLYKKYQNKGYTHSETVNYKHKDGRDDVSIITKWTQKGRLFLYEFLKEKEILPTIEKDLDLIR
jgi:phage antirepressor YoqD-like protein